MIDEERRAIQRLRTDMALRYSRAGGCSGYTGHPPQTEVSLMWRMCFLLLLIGALPPETTARELVPGDPAPDFALAGSDGQTHVLSTYRGKHVVLAWFPKAFTGG
jgi:hypothetical protein